ncbi:hypothetical protein [Actinospica sp.]|uniref:hypothetical protein n=1 Tax=Actinospica sp. TaxID=1872142 RepID=UPI002BA5C487|nr:hypothetical protein [Actinospica sp.]HWG26236.1 hypothetical protein [Actinospica sp.]
MVVAFSVEPARLMVAALITGWGLLAIGMGSIIWTNFGGVADFGARLARAVRGLEATHRRNTVRAYRRHGGFWMALGAGAVLCGMLAFLWAVS